MSDKVTKEEKKSVIQGLVIMGIIFVAGYKYGDIRAKSKLSADFLKVLNTATDKINSIDVR